MKLTKKMAFGFYAILATLLLGVNLRAANYDPNDWDDDLVLNTQEQSDSTSPIDSMKSAKYAERALVLREVPNGIKLPIPTRFGADTSFTMEMWYCPVSDGTPINGILFENTDSLCPYKVYVDAGKI